MEKIRLTGLKCLHGEAISYNRGLTVKTAEQSLTWKKQG